MSPDFSGSVNVVVGGGVGGLVAARELAIAGGRVVLLERSDRLGGRVASAQLAGVPVDIGAESFATRGGTVARLIGELGLAEAIVEPGGSAWVALPDRTVPLPAGGVLGIPGIPLAPDVRRAIGTAAAVRAYADRLLPVLKVGTYERLGPLVRSRMGEQVLARLVAPVVENVYGADPDEVPVELVAPGLNAAITATGALSAAVLRLRASAPAGAAAHGLAGGVARLVGALEADLRARGVEIRLGAEVIGVHPSPRGPGFTVVTPEADVVADRVVLAADGGAALDLLKDAAHDVATLPRPDPQVSRAVLLAVDDDRLDSAPRGTGVLRAASTPGIGAGALTHLTAKWPWLRATLPPARHLLRLSYRAESEVSDSEAVADASALLGIRIAQPLDRIDALWTDQAPPLDPRTVQIRARLADTLLPEGLAVVGAWTAGTGLAAVVARARTVAEPEHRRGTP